MEPRSFGTLQQIEFCEKYQNLFDFDYDEEIVRKMTMCLDEDKVEITKDGYLKVVYNRKWHKQDMYILFHEGVYRLYLEMKKEGKEKYYNIQNHIHRDDGPALIQYITERCTFYNWFYLGERYIFEEWCEKTNKTDEEIVFFKLKYGDIFNTI